MMCLWLSFGQSLIKTMHTTVLLKNDFQESHKGINYLLIKDDIWKWTIIIPIVLIILNQIIANLNENFYKIDRICLCYLVFLCSEYNYSHCVHLKSTPTVEPPNKGHFGNGSFVLSSEVVLFSEIVDFLLSKPP